MSKTEVKKHKRKTKNGKVKVKKHSRYFKPSKALMNKHKDLTYQQLRKKFNIDPNADDDGDRVPNYADCRPWDEARQDTEDEDTSEVESEFIGDFDVELEAERELMEKEQEAERSLEMAEREALREEQRRMNL